MPLFKTKTGFLHEAELADALSSLQIKGANLMLSSSLLSLGRPCDSSCPEKILDIFLSELGSAGTLSVPAFSFSAYNGESFDPERSKSIVGVLGERARLHGSFSRTVHPIYSHACSGKELPNLMKQDYSTCFGKNSYFDIFCSTMDSMIAVLGTTLSSMAFYHYYDQLYSAPGRFLKKFSGRILDDGIEREVEFDSYVKDYDFYKDKMNSLARFDALATELGLLKHIPLGDNYLHVIREKGFSKLYKTCLLCNQSYFLCSSRDEWEEYFPKNRFDLFHGKLEKEQLARAEKIFSSLEDGTPA